MNTTYLGGAHEKAQQLPTLAASAEELSLFLSTHVAATNHM